MIFDIVLVAQFNQYALLLNCLLKTLLEVQYNDRVLFWYCFRYQKIMVPLDWKWSNGFWERIKNKNIQILIRKILFDILDIIYCQFNMQELIFIYRIFCSTRQALSISKHSAYFVKLLVFYTNKQVYFACVLLLLKNKKGFF